MSLNKRIAFILLAITITIILVTVLFVSKTISHKKTEIIRYSPAPSSKIPDKREYPVNSSVNPCVNFYEYACTNVIENFKLREDRSRHRFSFDDARERILEAKKKYLLALGERPSESEIEKEIKNYYTSCMDKNARKKEELELVKKTKKLLNTVKTKKDFIALIANNITKSSQLSFITFNANIPNLDKPDYNDLYFNTRLMSLPEKSYYKNQEVIKDLTELIQQFFTGIGENSAKQKADWVVNFEKELAQKYPSPSEFRKRLFSRTRISREDLIKNYPYLELEGFLAKIPKHTTIRNIIGNQALKFLNEKLKTCSLEELKSIYLYFQLSPIMDDAYPAFFTKKLAFNNKQLGKPEKRDSRQERCTKDIMRYFRKEIDSILLPKLFPNFPKEKFTKLVEKIRNALLEQLQNNTWLDTNTKQEAIRKIQNAGLLLVSPNSEEEWDFNPRASYSKNTPLANRYKFRQLLMNKRLRELEKQINTNRWFTGPLTVNAFYHASYNNLLFPIGFLQHPFYDPNEPGEVNMGGIGVVIGHELGHAIDSKNSNFNADGVFIQWMSAKDKELFIDKTLYLIKQFNKIGHNGELTLPENIAELVGLSAAYKAAFPKHNDNDNDMRRKFFLQFARTACETQREKYAELRLKTDPHSLGHTNVNEQLKHQKGFKQAYNCKPEDPLVISEEEIVKVW